MRNDEPVDGQRRSPGLEQSDTGQAGSAGPAGRAPDGAEQEQPAPLIELPSLPTGGGAIRGMGDEWSVNLLTGTGAMSIPVPTSPGRSGFGPSLALSYDSASGNGPFGLGWQLGVPSISRRTDRGIPRYLDADESDTFVSGAGELVRCYDGPTPTPPRDVAGTWDVVTYRPRIEQDFRRIEKWVRKSDPTDVHWQTVDRGNIRRVFGLDATARVFDPDQPARIFRWLLQRAYDDRGNLVIYEYKAEDESGALDSLLYEVNRLGRGTSQRYLKRIRYGATTPYFCDGDTDPTVPSVPSTWHFEFVVDYGEHSDADPALAYAESAPWSLRPDPYSTYRAGFEVRTRRRARRMLMFHTELPRDDGSVGPQLVRSLTLAYDDGEAAQRCSKLLSATLVGYAYNGGSYTSKAMPALELGYVPFEVDTSVRRLDAGSPHRIADAITGRHRFADLEGEGIPGLLSEEPGAWHYARNLGSGVFDVPHVIAKRPNGSVADGDLSFMDVRGDGGVYAVSLRSSSPGYFERDVVSGDWLPFRPFKTTPNLPWGDADIRFVDIDGDGRADVLVSEGDRYRWYQSRGEDGFGAPKARFRVPDEADGPTAVFSDSEQSVFVADMSGDGMQDIVRVRNGSIAYWPNLGHGAFGSKVEMANAPWFERKGLFSASRVQLGDIDGSGTADIVYLSPQGATVWLNAAGNAWQPWRSDLGSADAEIIAIPALTSGTNVQVTDLLGTGTSCLVWSSGLPNHQQAPVRYVELSSSRKPYLLELVRNNRGMERRVTYASSTKFYLDDRAAGRPWVTKLPFPVQVIESTETLDLIGGGRLTSSYRYHHGYYDRVEREFRGFGLVEQTDAESFSPTLNADGGADWTLDPALADKFAPPIVTRTWHQLGSHRDGSRISDALEEEYWEPAAASPYLSALTDELPAPASTRDQVEALRSLRGRVIRTELYDGSGTDLGVPYAVSRSTYRVTRLQDSADDRPGAFFVSPLEAVSYAYEQDEADPRVSHSMTLSIDDYGNPLQQVNIGYPRHSVVGTSDALLMPQAELKAALSESTYFNSPADAMPASSAWYRLGLPVETQAFEYVPSGVVAGELLARSAVESDVATAGRVLPRQPIPTPGLRTTSRTRVVYQQNPVSGSDSETAPALASGQADSLALVYETQTLALTDAIFDDVYGVVGASGTPDAWVRRSFAADIDGIEAGLGYLADTDGWWARSGRVIVDQDSHFYLPIASLDAFGARSDITYDGHKLLIERSESPALGASSVRLTSEFEHDYRTLSAFRAKDPNGNYTSVETDPLGMVVAAATMGKDVSADQVPPEPPMTVFEGDDLSEPSVRFAYQLEYSVDEATGELLLVPSAQSETKTAFGAPWASAERLASVAYSDGFGRTLVTRARAGDIKTKLEEDPSATDTIKVTRLAGVTSGMRLTVDNGTVAETHMIATVNKATRIVTLETPLAGSFAKDDAVSVERWIASGRTVYDNKERPVRQYEPYFTGGELVGSDPLFQQVPRFELDDAATDLAEAVSVGATTLVVENAERFAEGQTIVFHDGSTDPVGVTGVGVGTIQVSALTAAHAAGTRIEVIGGRGVASLLTYDPLGRVVRTDAPDGTFSRVEFTPWEQRAFDACDTVLESHWHADMLAGSPEEVAAANASAAHAGTPTVTLLDSLARPYAVGTQSSAGGDILYERSFHDIVGNVLELQDRRAYAASEGLAGETTRPAWAAFTYKYDLLGRQLFARGQDNGPRWVLPASDGAGVFAWKGEEITGDHWFRTRAEFDALRRGTRTFHTYNWDGSGTPTERCAGFAIYGHQLTTPANDNYLGRTYRTYDAAGSVKVTGYDFAGNALGSERQLTRFTPNETLTTSNLHTFDPDWTAASNGADVATIEALANAELEELTPGTPEVFVSSAIFDAVGRPLTQTKPHLSGASGPTVVSYGYDSGGALTFIDAAPNAAGGAAPVGYIEYNARGQRLVVELGCGVTTKYGYDPRSFRLTLQTSTRASDSALLQSLAFTHDACGNIVRIHDGAQASVYFNNTVVHPTQQFTYDALYRLTQATGREHSVRYGLDPSVLPGSATGVPSTIPTDRELQQYTRDYTYDAAGNLKMVSVVGGWTRTLNVATDANRLESVDHSAWSYTEPGWTPPSWAVDHPTEEDWDPAPTSSYPFTLSHDQFGQMLAIPTIDDMRWDAAGNMRYSMSDTSASDERTWYMYGADNQRVRKVTEVTDTGGWRKQKETLYLGGSEIHRTYDASGLVSTRDTAHVMDGDRRVASLEKIDGSGVKGRYSLDNQVRSVSVEVADDGDVISFEEFHPYGTTAWYSVDTSKGFAAKQYRYSGKERDSETGLDYYGYRYLCSWLGRWTSPDPAGTVDGLNLTIALTNNPISSFDPDGRECDAVTDTSGELVGFTNCDGRVFTPARSIVFEDSAVPSSEPSVPFVEGARDSEDTPDADVVEPEDAVSEGVGESGGITVDPLEKDEERWEPNLFQQFALGAIFGDFNPDPSIASAIGQVAIGFIPGVGLAADVRDIGANVHGLIQGRPGSGAGLVLAVVGTIPVVGDSLKLAGRAAGRALRARRLIPRSSRAARAALGLGRGVAKQAHHLIPVAVARRSAAMLHAADRLGYDINNIANLIALETRAHAGNLPFHRGSHRRYSAYVQRLLDRLDDTYETMSPEQLWWEIRKIEDQMRDMLNSGAFGRGNTRLSLNSIPGQQQAVA